MLKLSKSIHSTSLFFRVASVVLISVILVSISIGIITIKISKDTLADTFSKSNYKVLTQISNELNTFNDNTINIMNAIDYIPDFQRYLSEKDLTPQQNYRTLYNMFAGFHKMIPDKDLYDITVLAVGINGNTYVASDSDRLIIDTNEVLK